MSRKQLSTTTEVTKQPTSGKEISFTFGPMDFNFNHIGKSYTYQVTETKSNGGTTLDTRTHQVTITVGVNSSDGKLKFTKTYKNDTSKNTTNSSNFTFTNTYPVPVTLSFTKAMIGRKIGKSDVMTFTLYPDSTNSGAPMPAGKGNIANVVGAILNSPNSATASFGAIYYTAKDAGYTEGGVVKTYSKTYKYSVKETALNDYTKNDTDLSDEVLTATVTVTYNASTNVLTATPKWGTNNTATDKTINNYPKIPITLSFYKNAGYNSTDKTAFIQWL